MLKLNVPTMSCGHCVSTIEKAVKAIDPAAEVTVDLPSRTVSVLSKDSDASVAQAIKDAGYESHLLAA